MTAKIEDKQDFRALAAKRRGFCFVVSAPSGAGKTSIVKALLGKDTNLRRSISVTTRSPRPGEKDGVQYYFKSENDFMKMVERGEFIEWAKVFENYYGTLYQTVEDNLKASHDILFDIDWQGHRLLKEKLPRDVVSLFVLPPSLKILKERLVNRLTDSQEIIDYRMAKAHEEISHCNEFDYVIINDQFSIALEQAYKIVEATRFRTSFLLPT